VSTRPLSSVRSLSPAYGLEQSPSVPLARGWTTSRRMPSMAIDLYLEPESDVDRPRLVDVWADAGPMFPPPTTTADVDVSAGRPESAIGVRLPVSSAGTVDLASPTRPAFVDVDRPGPASGVCPPASTLSASAAGPAQPRVAARSGLAWRQSRDVGVASSLSTPMSVDVVRQLGLARPPPTSVDIEYQPSLAPCVGPQLVDVASARQLGAVDVVDRPMLTDVHRACTLTAGVPKPTTDIAAYQQHLPATAAFQSGPAPSADIAAYHLPTPTAAAHQLESVTAVDVLAHRLPTAVADVPLPPMSTPAYASQNAAMQANVAVRTSAQTLTAQSLQLLDRHSPQTSSHSSVHHWLQSCETCEPRDSPPSQLSHHCQVPPQKCNRP